jgi:hypothetical protein
VYGDIKKKHKSKEEDPYNPSSPYSASKASGDLLIKSYIRTYKIPAIINTKLTGVIFLLSTRLTRVSLKMNPVFSTMISL